MKLETPLPIVALGELLWDLLPTGRRAGGAPFNFAFHCHQLGHPAVIVSRVGDDDLGRDLRAEVRRLGMSDEYLQTDTEHPTGTVRVELNRHGEPEFTIAERVAWDFLEWSPQLSVLAGSARAICFGTLGQRSAQSRDLIRRFVLAANPNCLVVCDLNFRPPFTTEANIRDSVSIADWLKVNESEAKDAIAASRLTIIGVDESRAQYWQRMLLETLRPDNAVIAVTRGENGCVVAGRGQVVELSGISTIVADTVGAGDAFTAALLTQHLEGKSLPDAAHFANAYAAVVVSKPGGTPPVNRAEVERFL